MFFIRVDSPDANFLMSNILHSIIDLLFLISETRSQEVEPIKLATTRMRMRNLSPFHKAKRALLPIHYTCQIRYYIVCSILCSVASSKSAQLMELSGRAGAGGLETHLARRADFGAPVSRAEPGPLQRVLTGPLLNLPHYISSLCENMHIGDQVVSFRNRSQRSFR